MYEELICTVNDEYPVYISKIFYSYEVVKMYFDFFV